MKKTILSMAAMMIAATMVSCCGGGTKPTETNDTADKYGIRFSEESTIDKEHKRVLILSGSPRKGGNSDLLCDEFARGAEEAGGIVEKIFLADYNINYFLEEDEQRTGERAHEAQDDAPMIVDKMVDADVIVLASPVYYMNITGQMKVLIDRTFSRFMEMRGKEFFYITTCADTAESTADWAINGFRGFVMCLPDPVERGAVKGVGLGRKGAASDSQFMQQAYELGKKI